MAYPFRQLAVAGHDRGLVPGTAEFELLAWYADNFTGLWVAFEFARTYAGAQSFSEQREIVLTIIHKLLDAGLIRLGEMSSEIRGLSYWTGNTTSQRRRLDEYISGLSGPPTPEANVWLHATLTGKHIVSEALDRPEN